MEILPEVLQMEIFSTVLLLGVVAFGVCIWLWRAFDWRWYPGFPLLIAGLLLAVITGALCVLMEHFPFGLGCSTSYVTNKWAGLAIGTFAAGCVVLISSPIIAFWRRAKAEARREA
jgi:hypothetical protein